MRWLNGYGCELRTNGTDSQGISPVFPAPSFRLHWISAGQVALKNPPSPPGTNPKSFRGTPLSCDGTSVVTERSIQPVFHAQVRDVFEVRHVARQQRGVMRQAYGGDLEIQRPRSQQVDGNGDSRTFHGVLCRRRAANPGRFAVPFEYPKGITASSPAVARLARPARTELPWVNGWKCFQH